MYFITWTKAIYVHISEGKYSCSFILKLLCNWHSNIWEWTWSWCCEALPLRKTWTPAHPITSRQNPGVLSSHQWQKTLAVSEKNMHVSSKAKCGSGRCASRELSHRLVIVFSTCITFTAYANYYAKNKNQARKALELQNHSKFKIPIIKAQTQAFY